MTFYLYSAFFQCAISLATLVYAADLKIDFSCHNELNTDSLNNLKEDCKLKTSNPLKRPCVDACILNDLGLLRKAFNSSKSSAWEYAEEPTSVSVELEDLFSDNQDLAEAVQQNVDAKCTEIMTKTIQEEKKTCENWDAIFTCVKEAACGAKVEKIDSIFPDLKCHPGYKKGPAREDHLQCRREIQNPFTKNCYKACMLQRFGIFEYSMLDEKEAVPRLGEVGNAAEGYSGGMVGELQWRFKENEELGVQLAKNIQEKCKDTFQKTVIDEKKPCDEWDPLFDCIKAAVACKPS